MSTRISRRAVCAGGLAASAFAGPAAAQLAVFDPTNYASNVLQAARALYDGKVAETALAFVRTHLPVPTPA